MVSVELSIELIDLLVGDFNVRETLAQLVEAEHTCQSQPRIKREQQASEEASKEPSEQGKKQEREKEQARGRSERGAASPSRSTSRTLKVAAASARLLIDRPSAAVPETGAAW